MALQHLTNLCLARPHLHHAQRISGALAVRYTGIGVRAAQATVGVLTQQPYPCRARAPQATRARSVKVGQCSTF